MVRPSDCPLQGPYNGFVSFTGVPSGCLSLGPGTYAESVVVDIHCAMVTISAANTSNVPVSGTIDGQCHVHASYIDFSGNQATDDITLAPSTTELSGSYPEVVTSAEPYADTYDLTGTLTAG